MADNVGNGDGATATVRDPSHYFAHHRREIKRARVSSEDLDSSISSLPDVILQVILSFIPTKFAIRTSVLSIRWRHVWCDTPSLSFFDDSCRPDPDSINKILSRYTVRKIMSFELCVRRFDYSPYLRSWIEFAMSRNVENLSLNHCLGDIPDFLYVNSSVNQLYVTLPSDGIKCSVSWPSLKILSLHSCINLSEESIAKILSGSPILETLRLYSCDELRVLDLRKSPRLQILEIDSESWHVGAKIVAPHIHSLRLRLTSSIFPYTLVDVSSLTEADLDIDSELLKQINGGRFLRVMVLLMLTKLQNVEKLTFGENFLKALADLRGLSFLKFKAKVLTLETTISRYVISGIVRVLLQNSPELNKLTVHTMDCDAIRGEDLDNYLELCGLNPYQCSEARVFGKIYSRKVESKHVGLFMQLVLKTSKTLEKMVVRLGPYRNEKGFKELLQMVPMLSTKTMSPLCSAQPKPELGRVSGYLSIL